MTSFNMNGIPIGEVVPREYGSNLVYIKLPGFKHEEVFKGQAPYEVLEQSEDGGTFYFPRIKEVAKADKKKGWALEDLDPDWSV